MCKCRCNYFLGQTLKRPAFAIKLDRVPQLKELFINQSTGLGTSNSSRKFNPLHFAEKGQVRFCAVHNLHLPMDNKGKPEKCQIISADVFSEEMKRRFIKSEENVLFSM